MAKCFLPRTLARMWLLAAVFALAGCAVSPPPAVPEPPAAPLLIAPLAKPEIFPVDQAEAARLSRALSPATQGLASWTDMAFAVEQSLAHARSVDPFREAFRTWDRVVTYGELARALADLKALLPRLDANPELLASRFSWYRMGPDFGFTGYYEPELDASPVRTERFRHPLYKRPPELGRARRRPYHNRHAIDCKGALRGRGLEIAWVEDPVDAFILQIQGSGRLRYADGRVRYALYAGQNGHKYVSLGRVMRERGLLAPDDISMDTIRDWLARHPAQRTDLLDTNPSYVFFRLSDTPSLGSMGRILTPWVSVATDQRVLPNGSLTFMALDLPFPEGTRPFRALTLPQDTGGAIRNNRVDIFCGNGPTATAVAGNLDTRGAVYVLLPNR